MVLLSFVSSSPSNNLSQYGHRSLVKSNDVVGIGKWQCGQRARANDDTKPNTVKTTASPITKVDKSLSLIYPENGIQSKTKIIGNIDNKIARIFLVLKLIKTSYKIMLSIKARTSLILSFLRELVLMI